MAQERLQKILASAGIASRRACELYITERRVRVNGQIIDTLGAKADPDTDRIEVDGKRIAVDTKAYYVFHKPRMMVTTLSDPEGRMSVADVLETVTERVFPVGRLDYHTSGVLLLTNDGELAAALLHPSRKVQKRYQAKINGLLKDEDLQAIANGVTLDDGHVTSPAVIAVLREENGKTWVDVAISEGKNRQIHRMFEALGMRVMRLHRVAFAGLSADALPPGELRAMTQEEVRRLKALVTPQSAPGSGKRATRRRTGH